jgi:hypothetical protein
MGVNIAQLRAILTAKLMMDDRRPIHLNRKNKKTEGKPSKFIGIFRFFLSLLLGIVLIFPLITDANKLVKLVILFTLFIIILSLMLITDFTAVLLDGKDNQIILPKPVNDRTFLISRILHLIIFILDIAIPIALPAAVTLYFSDGWRALFSFVILIPFIIFFTVFFLNVFYLLMLKYTSIERFKNIVTNFQILLAVIIYGGYQLIPRWMGSESFKSYSFPENISSLLIPSYWFAAAWQILHQGFDGGGIIRIVAATLGFIVPIISIRVMIIYFAPSFNRKLAGINTSGLEENKASPIKESSLAKKTSKPSGKKYYQWLSEKFTRKGAEKMGFEFTWLLTARSRDFKLKTYPGLGYIVVYVFLMIYTKKDVSLSNVSDSESAIKLMLVSMLYVSMFFLIGALNNSKTSEKYKAAWIFYIAPIRFPGAIITGTVKSILLKFAAPFLLLCSVLGIWLLGWIAIPNLLLAIGNLVVITYLTAYVAIKELPFSVPEYSSGRGTNFLINLLIGVLPIIFGVMHFFIFTMLPLVVVCCLVSFAAVWYLHTSQYDKHWQRFNPAYVETNDGI